jgi:hypothetical protein
MPRNPPGPPPFEAKALRGRCSIERQIDERRADAAQTGAIRDARGDTVNNNDASQGESLEESTRQHNSNLQRLIEAVGGLLSASGDLLVRLQQILSRGQPADDPPADPDQPDETPPQNGQQC